MGYPIQYLPFKPDRGQNSNVNSTSTSNTISISSSSRIVRVCNSGSETCYVRLCFTAEDATTADMPVLPGKSIVMAKGAESLISYYSASTTTIHIQTGYTTNQFTTPTEDVNLETANFIFKDTNNFVFIDGNNFIFKQEVAV